MILKLSVFELFRVNLSGFLSKTAFFYFSTSFARMINLLYIVARVQVLRNSQSSVIGSVKIEPMAGSSRV